MSMHLTPPAGGLEQLEGQCSPRAPCLALTWSGQRPEWAQVRHAFHADEGGTDLSDHREPL